MEVYKVQDRFWTDPALTGAGGPVKLLALYLITSPHGHTCGLYPIRPEIIAVETELPAESVERAMAALEKRGFARYDRERCVVWVRRMLRNQYSSGRTGLPGIAISQALRQLGACHGSPLVDEFLEAYPEVGEGAGIRRAAPGDDSGPALIEFPVKAAGKNGDGKWPLRRSLVARYAETYDVPERVILAELKQAAIWCETNPSKRKTPQGMPRFLTNWLNRWNNRGGAAAGGGGAQPTDSGRYRDLN